MAAADLYQQADEAYTTGAYEQATKLFGDVIDLVPDHADALTRRADAQHQWDLAEAEAAYAEAVKYESSGDIVRAYWAYDQAVGKVSDFKDAAARRQAALNQARYEVGLFVMLSDQVGEQLTPQAESSGRFGRMMSPISRLSQKSIVGNSLLEEHQDYAYRIAEDALDRERAPYIDLRRRGEMRRLLEQSGVNPDRAHYDQVIPACQASQIPVVVFAEFTEAYTTLEKRQANVIVWTTKKVDYTDEKGKKRKREVGVKSYKTERHWMESEMACTVTYRIINTATGALVAEGEISASDEDAVDFIAWNNYDGVNPRDLRRKDANGFKALSSSNKAAIDARSTLKSDAEMYHDGAGQIGAELAGRLLQTLTHYSPQ